MKFLNLYHISFAIVNDNFLRTDFFFTEAVVGDGIRAWELELKKKTEKTIIISMWLQLLQT